MTSFYSAQSVINLIVKQSKQKINQNNLVKNMLVPYSNTLAQTNRNDAILHVGAQFDRSKNNFFKHQIDSEQKPKNSIKDTYSFFALKKNKIQKKQNLQFSMPKQISPKKNAKNFFKSINLKSNTSHKQRSMNKNTSTPAKSTLQIESLKQSFLIRLEQEKKQLIPRFMEKEQRHINYLREIKNEQYEQKQTQRKREEQNMQTKTARQNKILGQLETHLAKPNNSYTYDLNGALVFCSDQNNKKAIKKAYPPALRYGVDNEEQFELFNEHKRNSNRNKNRAYSNLQFKRNQKINGNILSAKGQIFKSSVLKTINLSRISMGNQHLDQAQFMRRNDLFNNNHTRQTTSIPFLKMETGTAYKQAATNQSISNKETQNQQNSKRKQTQNSMNDSRSKSHDCRAKKQFKKYSLRQDSFQNFNIKLQLESAKKAYFLNGKNSQKSRNLGDSKYSSFSIQRPRTTEVGRIRKENQILFNSLLEQNY